MKLCFDPNFDTSKTNFFAENLKWRIDLLAKFLGAKEWLLGYITTTDFWFYELLQYVKGIYA